ncbi:venom dipeptidyl peptidase 4 isoform X1 [Nasonia vitripennis]|uniref:Venom dipeptidyl peptidase 4 n=2 Tax=Nasonia vitripennis TaxID=7425 RepID=A0A7M7LTQ4_NASVI|nr:venom dipeptidyl peptidase 4 isoform X1 [Nasonia vitripennis]
MVYRYMQEQQQQQQQQSSSSAARSEKISRLEALGFISDPNNSDNEDSIDPLINGNHVPLVGLQRKPKHIRRNRITLMHRRRELMTKSTGCNTRRLLVVGLIATIVLVLVITATAAILLTSADREAARTEALGASGISVEEWLGGSLSTKSFNGTWLSGDEILYEDESGNLMIFDASSRQSRNVLNITNSALVASFDHQFSADRKYLLLAFNYQRLFRHTYLAQYKIVNLETLQETLLSGNESSGLQLAVWAPQGNALVYVFQSNIYYRPQAEVPDDYQITVTGAFGTIYNGVPDWVYEEEVFSSNKAMWFSPSGTKLAFGHFDDTHTPIMNIPYYGFPGLTFQYPSAIPIHYPKSGTQNPTVKLFYVDLEQVVKGNVSLIEIEAPLKLSYTERILASVSFPTDGLVSAIWMNRVQNQAYFHMCNVIDRNCSTALAYKERNGWVEQFVPPLYSKDGTAFVLILPQKQGNRGDWRHAVLVTEATTKHPIVTALTSGLFVVTEIVAWDEDNHYVYYLATSEQDPAQKHLYRVSILDRNRRSDCLSCEIKSESDGSYCLYNSAEFSKDNSHYVLTCAGPGIPEITIHNRNSTKVYAWESNIAVAELIAEKSRPTVKRFTVPVPGGFEAQVKLLLPPNADLSGKTKYPMLLYVYGGPDTNEVTEKFNIDWGTYLVTNKSIIYASIDGRGSGLKGNSMMFAVYRNLGTVEIMDQINVTRHLQNSFSYIDRSRTAIWGWSYGGYATGMALAMDFDGIFKCGLSVAPVTDWTLYDSVYTERFMGLPNAADNLGGYDQSQLLNKVDNIKNKGYYLIHGTLDDNVHYQQSMLLAKMLEQKDILFRQQTYTDETHDIARMRLHLYHSMENFLDECFKTSS